MEKNNTRQACLGRRARFRPRCRPVVHPNTRHSSGSAPLPVTTAEGAILRSGNGEKRGKRANARVRPTLTIPLNDLSSVTLKKHYYVWGDQTKVPTAPGVWFGTRMGGAGAVHQACKCGGRAFVPCHLMTKGHHLYFALDISQRVSPAIGFIPQRVLCGGCRSQPPIDLHKILSSPHNPPSTHTDFRALIVVIAIVFVVIVRLHGVNDVHALVLLVGHCHVPDKPRHNNNVILCKRRSASFSMMQPP